MKKLPIVLMTVISIVSLNLSAEEVVLDNFRLSCRSPLGALITTYISSQFSPDSSYHMDLTDHLDAVNPTGSIIYGVNEKCSTRFISSESTPVTYELIGLSCTPKVKDHYLQRIITVEKYENEKFAMTIKENYSRYNEDSTESKSVVTDITIKELECTLEETLTIEGVANKIWKTHKTFEGIVPYSL